MRLVSVILPKHPEWPYVPPEVVKTRENLVNAVQSAIDAELGRQFKVKPFGSTIYGADTPDSDIDLVIFVRIALQFVSWILIESQGSHVSYGPGPSA